MDVTLDLANRSRRIDRLYVVGRAGGVGKSIVEPALIGYTASYRIRCVSAPCPRAAVATAYGELRRCTRGTRS